MDEKNISSTFMALLTIVETLRGCISDIDEIYKDAIKEVSQTWKMKRQ